ncbi:hypothetical protein K7432_007905 [Basidiobolus ranarum]|uniref:VWFA domain-containing protein n=1 Tax=Basidiobolus ranarum TaxID=34480 RepID=A0ABR2WSL5_9FUNG
MAQDCLESLCNHIVANSYAELTHVNYHALDQRTIKLLGVYGNRPAIRKFVTDVSDISQQDAESLMPDSDLTFNHEKNSIDVQEGALHAGLYLLLINSSDELKGFVIHWPEPQCYSDKATSNTKKNCIMFHRYLCKLTEQQLCLVSDDDLNNFEFQSDEDNLLLDACFTFEVKKTQEQKEDFQISTGFVIPVKSDTPIGPVTSTHHDIQKHLNPQVVDSETKQSFLTCQFVPSTIVERCENKIFYNNGSTRSFLEKKLSAEKCRLVFDPSLSHHTCKEVIECLKSLTDSPLGNIDDEYQEVMAQIEEDKSKRGIEIKERFSNFQSDIKKHARIVTDNILSKSYPEWYAYFINARNATTMETSRSESPFENETDALESVSVNILETENTTSTDDSEHTKNAELDSLSQELELVKTNDDTTLSVNLNEKIEEIGSTVDSFDDSDELIECQADVDKQSPEKIPGDTEYQKSLKALLKHDSNILTFIKNKLKRIGDQQWIEQKTNFILAHDMYKRQKTGSFSDAILKTWGPSGKEDSSLNVLKGWLSHLSSGVFNMFKPETKQTAKSVKRARGMSDADFITMLLKATKDDVLDDREAKVIHAIMIVFNNILMEYCEYIVDEIADELRYLLRREMDSLKTEIESQTLAYEKEYIIKAKNRLEECYSGVGRPFKIKSFDTNRNLNSISYSEETKQPDIIRYYLHLTYIQESDIRELEQGSDKILTPQFEGNSSKQLPYHFEVQYEDQYLKHIYQTNNGKFLVFLSSYTENTLKVYYAAASMIGRQIKENNFLKRFQIHPENAMVAVNEASQLIALYDKSSAEANIYIFDEECETLCNRYSNIQIKLWYDLQTPNISHILFPTGSEELCFIESNGKARIYSMIQQQILPNSMLIPENATRVMSTPDGSCLIALLEEVEPICMNSENNDLTNSVILDSEVTICEGPDAPKQLPVKETRKLMAYVWFWSDFGQTEKVRKIELPHNVASLDSISTSMVGGQQVHLTSFNTEQHIFTSAYVGITLERNQWQFREKLAPSKFRGKISLAINEVAGNTFFFTGKDTSFKRDIKPNGHIIFVGNRFTVEEVISDILLKVSFVSEHSWIPLEKLRTFDIYHYETPSKINDLLDCYKSMWERYPVNSFIEQESGLVDMKSMQYLRIGTNTSHILNDGTLPDYKALFEAYMNRQIHNLDNDTRKPISKLKNDFKVDVVDANSIDFTNLPESWFNQYYCGRWLIKLGCLLPIQIAVARENQFVPLKDGISCHDLDNQLAGGDIPTLAANCTLGWYESIFTYYCDYPVKVISSMGSQSLGKSFLLNHLADSSFAGAATRCTEGIWLSLTPTRDESGPYLCVLLDFEGLKSIERTPQEDVLMNLFNAAISNLILFKNDFAIGRDIHDLFQRFQSGATIFDPAQNPSLFHSHMVIVIRDVPNNDRSEIVREFQSKFSQIVSKEGEDNFITKLHGSRLSILPWPMFNDPQFYTTFNSISKMLNQQKFTHSNARQFLQNIKVLMCKMKICDWSSLDNNLIQIRTKHLSSFLTYAIATGTEEMEPFVEPLKNYDDGTVLAEEAIIFEHNLDIDDETHYVELPCDSGLLLDSEETFKEMSMHIREWVDTYIYNRQKWPKSDVRWFEVFSSLTQKLIQRRRTRVINWIDQNIGRFPPENSDISTLQHNLSQSISQFESKWEICGLTCSHCNLRCLLNRFHNEEHDCCTDHTCHHACSFSSQHEGKSLIGGTLCGLHAGHDEAHVCDTAIHLCGAPCVLHKRRNCLKTCAKAANHKDEEHKCQSSVHFCGQPCSLQGVIQHDSTVFNCNNLCIIPCETPHDTHKCENQSSCPLTCPLGCNLTCKSRDHFHALTEDAHHFCGNEHSCPELCEVNGICEIKLEPQVAEEMYSNKHGSFMYTKYTQIAHKLRCCKKIPPNSYTHRGIHQHTVDTKLFHHCHKKCPNCEYFCTLPIGHPQKLHETSHGNMINTRFSAVDNEFELQSHTFNVGDSGSCFLCNMYCQELGPHTHIEYCEIGPSHSTIAVDKERQHVQGQLKPFPDRPKDFITHKLFWERTGFKDPYGKEKQDLFGRCDAFCPDEKHKDKNSNRSYCTLRMFHAPLTSQGGSLQGTQGYISNDGHFFECANPTVDKSKYHIIFCLDTSSSMLSYDFRPIVGSPLHRRLQSGYDNRFGAVLDATYRFLQSRQSTWSNEPDGRDAVSVVLFSTSASVHLQNDTNLDAMEIIESILSSKISHHGTDYDSAMMTASRLIQSNWDPKMPAVIIFLSDGECGYDRELHTNIFENHASKGQATGFFSILFSPTENYSSSLKEMAQIAKAQYRTMLKQKSSNSILSHDEDKIPCGYHTAINEVDLSQHFLQLAKSLREQHPSLMRN